MWVLYNIILNPYRCKLKSVTVGRFQPNLINPTRKGLFLPTSSMTLTCYYKKIKLYWSLNGASLIKLIFNAAEKMFALFEVFVRGKALQVDL